MIVRSVEVQFHVASARSLKQKRMVARSLIDGARRKFNASIAEVDTQDAHQLLTIGAAVVSGDAAHAREMLDEIVRYLEIHAAADLISVDWSD